jgi:hypothetical protein
VSAISPFDFINSFNAKTKYLIESDLDEKDYAPWVINKGLSFTRDTVLFANEMNQFYELDRKMQHDFYYHGIPKGKRYGKWLKLEKVDVIELLSEYYGINKMVAATYMQLLDDKQIAIIREKMVKGGRHGNISK